jgi:hypothetical protein
VDDIENPFYRISVVTGVIVRCDLIGYWTDAVATEFERDLLRTLADLTGNAGAHGRYQLLVDYSHSQVQSQTMSERLRSMSASIGAHAARMAIIAPNPLVRMQAKRMPHIDNFRFFESADDGLEWLQHKFPRA